ncbi:hypothetical protein [Gloeocapsopsis dulcis]|uniref:hypothetical protein n=1 Tax=Gloeocapsopsis dulcis TaxID=2859516 RepID=UPI00137A7DE9|nr:hypothetical protein [Gloeocapsopsis dulcis]
MYIEGNFRQFVYVSLMVSTVKNSEILGSKRQATQNLLGVKSNSMYQSDTDVLTQN